MRINIEIDIDPDTQQVRRSVCDVWADHGEVIASDVYNANPTRTHYLTHFSNLRGRIATYVSHHMIKELDKKRAQGRPVGDGPMPFEDSEIQGG